ncbi:PREDICTED: probable inactive receptor kinase RLK902 [Nicotiana attenuata]|uniref:Inactive receptor kinase rlk902 n=1 Tax=Nicotiana attenuata TaxID=49451 RepID=A0A1J6KCA6_NICAT|nr:PREDICTED: probable inactive receptor kinase RLK902 [Nicotiana attenuata]OIT27717.1 putative inactive receptor kinase rlk902 [Nicotiana attenuata]
MSSKILIFFTISIFLIFRRTTSDIVSDRSTLLSIRSALRGRSLLWNITSPTCSWPGVICSPDKSSVLELHLPGMGLSGQIPPGLFSNLTKLNFLSLRYNALSGVIPADLFSPLKDLKNLYLQHNLFSGPVPDSIFSLSNLVRLNLAHNNFSGPIPSSFNNLTGLGTLYLQDNGFSGQIPDLNLPGLVQFNVSDNQLNGSIPSKLSGQPKDSFLGTSLCGKPLNSCDNNNGDEGGKEKKLSGGAIAGIVIGCVIGLILILLLLFFCCCRKKSNKETTRSADVAGVKEVGIEIPEEKGVESHGGKDGFLGSAIAAIGVGGGNKDKGKAEAVVGNGKSLVFFGKMNKSFDLDDLLKASAEVLGKGTFGTAYKAALESGITLVVKRLRDVTVPEKEFREKIEEVGKLNHENLVPLRAYYYSGDEKLLVYDYISMGSLSALLHGNKGAGRTPLNWETRAGIALGAAHGIAYLHTQGPSVSHGNIKSSNILLTKSYEARVSDFGLAQLVGPSSTPNRVAGYRAPEVTDPRKVSQKADVYSFGVLLLELLTGKAPTHSLMNEEGVDLPRWVQSVVREEWTAEVFDLELLRYQNVEEDMVQLLQLAVDCTAQYPDRRPSMAEVTSRVEELCRSSFMDSGADTIDNAEVETA